MRLPRHDLGSPDFDAALAVVDDRMTAGLDAVEPVARQIVGDVRHGGDRAVRRYAERLDGGAPERLLERPFDGAAALDRLPGGVSEALRAAAGRLQRFWQRQREVDMRYEEGGLRAGLRLRPVRRAAICAPGPGERSALGVLEAAIPARVAGVADVLLATPRPDDLVLAAAHLAGVTALVPVGGAQAVAALAFGTETIPRVEVIAGDGGLHGACARRLVLGHVQIDGLGGPTELLVVADTSADAGVVAADLLGCAEAGEGAWPVLVTSEARVVTAVEQELDRQLARLPRRLAAASALTERGLALVVRQRQQLVEVAGRLAFDQVVLHVERPDDVLDRLPAAGAVAWGPLTPPVLLPGVGARAAGGAARFGGAGGVWAFLTRTAHVHAGPAGLRAQADGAARLARADGREGLALATELRLGLPAARGVGHRELES